MDPRKKQRRRRRLFETLQPRLVLNADLPVVDEVSDPEPIAALESFGSADALTERLLAEATERWAELFGQPLRSLPPLFGDIEYGNIEQGDIEHGLRDRIEAPAGEDPAYGTAVPFHDEVYAYLEPPYPFPLLQNDPVVANGQLYALQEGRLSIFDVEDPAEIQLLSETQIGFSGELYVVEDRLAIVSRSHFAPYWGAPERFTDVHLADDVGQFTDHFSDRLVLQRPEVYPHPDPLLRGGTTVTVLNVANPTSPEKIHTSILSGGVLDTELLDGTLHAIHQQRIHLPRPHFECEPMDELPIDLPPAERLRDFGSELLDGAGDRLTIDPNWPLPRPWPEPSCNYESEESYVTRLKDGITESALATVFDPDSGESTLLSDFSSIVAAADGSLDVQVSLMSLDLNAEEVHFETTSVLGDRVHAADFDASGVVVANSSWHGDDGRATELTLFSFGESGVEVSVGQVKGGRLSGQSLDVSDGTVRVATAHRSAEDDTAEQVSTTQLVSVLAPDGDRLEVTAQVAIGEDSSILTASLFENFGVVGPLIQSGPVQAIDLSDASSPQVGGDLQLTGFAGFVEQVGATTLLALGNSHEDPASAPFTLDLSLHDLSNTEEPSLLDRVPLTTCHEDTIVIPAGAPQFDSANGILVMPVIELSTAEAVELAKADLPRLLEFPFAQELLGRVRQLVANHTEPESLLRLLADCLAVQPVDPPAEETPTEESPTEDSAEAEFGHSFQRKLRVWSVTDEALTELGDLQHEEQQARFPVIRSGIAVSNDHLFVVSTDEVVAYALTDLSTPVGSIFTGPFAEADQFEVPAGSTEITLDVLANDRTNGAVAKIIAVSDARGEVQIADDGSTVLYSTPSRFGFARFDGFVYTAQLEDGRTSEAYVSIEISHAEARERMIDLVTNDLAERLDVNASDIELVTAEERIWPDGCLGLPGPYACTLATVPGFLIKLQHDDRIYEYRTDRQGIFKLVERQAEVRVVDDRYDVSSNSGETRLDVLANDFPGINFIRQPDIESVTQPESGSEVQIGSHGGFLIYTPAEDFVGRDVFTYTVDLGLTATVTVHVEEVVPLVQYSLEITNADGVPIDVAVVGQELLVNVFVEDLRDDARGVFAGYLDLEFSDQAKPAGSIVYGSAFPNGQEGVFEAGLIDEVGAFASLDPIGSGQFLLLQIPFTARDQGTWVIEADPADAFIVSETLVFGLDWALTDGEVLYDRAQIEITNPLHNEENPTDVNGDGVTTSNDALAAINKLNESGAGPITASDVPFAAEGEIALHYFYDVSNDGQLSPMDPLAIINLLNGRDSNTANAEGEGQVETDVVASAAVVQIVQAQSETGSDRGNVTTRLDDDHGDREIDLSRVNAVPTDAVWADTDGEGRSTIDDDDQELEALIEILSLGLLQ